MTEIDQPTAPRVLAEPRELDSEHLELLAQVAQRVVPEAAELGEWSAKYARQHRTRLAGDLWLLAREAPDGARLLEYGAVPLQMTAALSELGYAVSALDVAPERFAGAIDTLSLDVLSCDVEVAPVPFESDTFDVILFNEIFEHLRINPLFTMREALRVLRPEGKLLLSTPNLRSLRGLKNLIVHNEAHAASGDVYGQYEKLETLGHMGHVREYTTKEVAELLRRIGFRVDALVYRGGYGRGFVGLVERLLPSLRPFFSVVAVKPGGAQSNDGGEAG